MKYLYFVFGVLILVVIGTSLFMVLKKPVTIGNSNTNNSLPYDLTKIEIADTEEERSLGLMNRKEICDTCGMLFVFDEVKAVTFWMKNTSIPLDMIFINQDNLVVNIVTNTKPNQTTEVYSSKFPTKYVLEVNANWSSKHNIKIGDKIDKQLFYVQEQNHSNSSNPK
jgi:uncharacterized protein